jgi:[ribosomal protein S5]-alanine N-acetyltransferase
LFLAGNLAAVSHVLTTERLVLRPVAAQDHAGLLAHWTEPDVRRFLFDGALLSSAEITRAIEDSARDFAAAGYGLWLMRETDGTDLACMAGLRPLEDIGLEVFYSLTPGARARGTPLRPSAPWWSMPSAGSDCPRCWPRSMRATPGRSRLPAGSA